MRLPPRIENSLIAEVGLTALLREDLRNHYGDWTRPGFRAIATYRLGAWARQLKNPILRASLSLIHRSAFRFVRNIYGIELYYTAKIGRRLHIAHQGAIVIHEHVTICDDCIIRQGVTIGIGGLDRNWDAIRPKIGNRVDIGAGAMIVGSIRIGDDVRIGPNAVVIIDVPPNTTALAPPARLLPGAVTRLPTATTGTS